MISVALAAYNGEKYIEQQILSILPQLSHNDEIIVSDDKPGGQTEHIVRRLMADDPRITYVEGRGKAWLPTSQTPCGTARETIFSFATRTTSGSTGRSKE